MPGRRRATTGLLHAGRGFARAAAAVALLTGTVIPAGTVQARPWHAAPRAGNGQASAPDPAIEFLKERGDLSSQEAIELADLALGWRSDRLKGKDKAAKDLIASQKMKLASAKTLLEAAKAEDSLGNTVQMAKIAARAQAQSLGISLKSPAVSPGGALPSKAVTELVFHHRISTTEEQKLSIKALDRLPATVRGALADVIYSFSGFEAAAEAAGAKALPGADPKDQQRAQALMKKLAIDDDLVDQIAQDPEKAHAALEAKIGPQQIEKLTPDERKLLDRLADDSKAALEQANALVAPVLSARLGLLEASGRLAKAVEATPAGAISAAISDDKPVGAGSTRDAGPAPAAPKAEQAPAMPTPGSATPPAPGRSQPPPSGAPQPTSPPGATAPSLPGVPNPSEVPSPGRASDSNAPAPMRLALTPSCTPPRVDIPPIIALELDGKSNDGSDGCVYGLDQNADGTNDKPDVNADAKVDEADSDYRLVIDVGGNDVYQNNAGGSGALVAPVSRNGLAGALLDLGGNDSYMSKAGCTTDGSGHSVNCRGGGVNGGGHSFDSPEAGFGAGFLMDTGGDDTHTAGEGGTNGGGYGYSFLGFLRLGSVPRAHLGLGFLLDAAGDDIYSAGGKGANGGGYGFATNGAASGLGFLMDAGGMDSYTAGGDGTNGGGYALANIGVASGLGFLMDAGGMDSYTAGGDGTNGGGYALANIGVASGLGFLMDAGGMDSYTAGGYGTNGGGYMVGGICAGVAMGFMMDAEGDDAYTAGSNGTNGGGYGNVGVAAGSGSGYLLDAEGDDAYTAGSNGTNGGGYGNVGVAAGSGSGYLLDAGGNDTYTAGDYGTNGGGWGSVYAVFPEVFMAAGVGSGYLLDAGGDDSYAAGSNGTNGGGYGSGTFAAGPGSGYLLDAGGDDSYAAGNNGTNGGAYGSGVLGAGAPSGSLLDAGGNDTYTAGSNGTNGGAYGSGSPGTAAPSGHLLDAGGNDTYTAGSNGTNGGAFGSGHVGAGAASGYLLDAGGNDSYTAGSNGTNGGSYALGGPIGIDVPLPSSVGPVPLPSSVGPVPLPSSVGPVPLPSSVGPVPLPFVEPERYVGYGVTSGYLLDAGGDDIYRAGDNGTNGGAFGSGRDLGAGAARGYLLDAEGNDSYTAGAKGTNGGSAIDSPGSGAGLLKDTGGSDQYSATKFPCPSPAEGADCDGSGADKTVIPKGPGGAQIDSPREVPRASISDVSLNEGDTGANDAVFTVTLDRPPAKEASVDYKTQDETATVVDNDYQPQEGVVKFDPGETSKTISIKVNGDTKGEPHETFFVNLSKPVNASVDQTALIGGQSPVNKFIQGDGQGVGTILTGDLPGLSVSDLTLPEGDSGASNAVIGVTLTNPVNEVVTVDFASADGTATTAGGDYKSSAGNLTFAPNETTRTVEVPVNGDIQSEPDETFWLNLSNPSPNVQIGDGQGQTTIQNDDGGLSINDVSVAEGDLGTTDAVFTVSFSRKDPQQTASVDYSTADSAATILDNDYRAAGGALTFNAGQTTKTFTVLVNGDTHSEPNEDFKVSLANSQAAIVSGLGSGTIINDDGGLSISDAAVTEGNSGMTSAVFTVSLSEPSAKTVKVNYQTADETASASDNDYQAAGGVLTFNSTETQKTIAVAVRGDFEAELTETFLVNLSDPSGAILIDSQGKGSIVNDEATVSINDVTIAEPASGTAEAVFTVSVSPPQPQPVSVEYATVDGSATFIDGDYRPATGTVSFAAGETQKMVPVLVNADGRSEEWAEDFFLKLSYPVAASLVEGRDRGKGTIKGAYQYQDGRRRSGGVFVSGHDAEDHGASNIIRKAVAYVTHNKPQPRLLYVTGLGVPHAQTDGVQVDRVGGGGTGIRGMREAGFGDFDVARARNAVEKSGASLGPEIEEFANKDVATVDFSEYDVVVVACSEGCGLTQNELTALNLRSDEIMRYVNAGGGLVAFEESLLVDQFGFLPFLRGQVPLLQDEDDFRVTNFGSEIGLSDSDVNSNISHNVFLSASGFGVVDVDGAGRFVSLATRKLIGALGAIDENGDDPPGDDDPPTDSDDRPPRDAAGLLRIGPPPEQPPPPAQGPTFQPSSSRADLTTGEPPAAALRQTSGQGGLNLPANANPQNQAQAQLQAQLQAQQQAQAQQQIQAQMVAVPVVEAAPGLQVKTELVRESERDKSAKPARKDSGHLASALGNTGATGIFGFITMAALLSLGLGLTKPKRPRATARELAFAQARRGPSPSRGRPNRRRR